MGRWFNWRAVDYERKTEVQAMKRRYYAIAPMQTEEGLFMSLYRFAGIKAMKAFVAAGDDRARVSWQLARVMFPALNRGPESHKTFWTAMMGKGYEGEYLSDESGLFPVTAEYRRVR